MPVQEEQDIALIKRATILGDVLRLLAEIMSDWDNGFAGPATQDSFLVQDIGCTSGDLVPLEIALEDHFKTRPLNCHELFVKPDGRVVDVKVSELVDFLYTRFANRQRSSTAAGD